MGALVCSHRSVSQHLRKVLQANIVFSSSAIHSEKDILHIMSWSREDGQFRYYAVSALPLLLPAGWLLNIAARPHHEWGSHGAAWLGLSVLLNGCFRRSGQSVPRSSEWSCEWRYCDERDPQVGFRRNTGP